MNRAIVAFIIAVAFSTFAVPSEAIFRRFGLFIHSNDDLVSKKGFDVFLEMAKDDEISSSLDSLKAQLTMFELNEVQQEFMDKYTNEEFADFLETLNLQTSYGWPIRNQIQKRLRGELK